MTMEDGRKKIDGLDLKLVELINQRAEAAREDRQAEEPYGPSNP
jgi:chorismate mutase